MTNTMFGMEINEVDEMYESAISKNHLIAGLMSDAQELISYDRNEEARQILNQAKYLFFKFNDELKLNK